MVGAGQLRQDVVGRRRRRDRPGQHPGPDRLWRAQRQGQLRARLPDSLAGTGRHRRHAGRNAARPHARWHAEPLHRSLRRRDLPGPPPSERHARRSLLHRTGRPHRPAREGRRLGWPDAAAQCPSQLRIPAVHRSPVSSGCDHQRARRHALPDGHVHRDHPGCPVRRTGFVPAAEDRSARARQAAQLGPHLANQLRRHDTRSAAAADVPRDAGATGEAPGARERLVARHCAERARSAPGQVRGPGARRHGEDIEQSAGEDPRTLDARGSRRARRRARSQPR